MRPGKRRNDRPIPNDRVDDMVRKAMRGDVPAAVEGRLRGQFVSFREKIEARDEVVRSRPSWGRMAFRYAGAMTVAAVIVWVLSMGFQSLTQPTWADVVERFDSVPFVNATIYVKPDALADPVQVEVWMKQSGQVRLRVGNEMAFGRGGRLVERVEFAPPAPSPGALRHAQMLVQPVIRALGDAESFSFETFLEVLPVDVKFAAPLPSQEATISNDLVVFDMASGDTPDWMRVWALRESRLPVRVLFWDPVRGGSVDLLLSYEYEQDDSFFDPEAFKASLSAGDSADHAYGLLRDPGGHAITPGDVEAWKLLQKQRQEEESSQHEADDGVQGRATNPST